MQGELDMNSIYLYNTSSYAKERLMSILVSDRIGCNPEFLGEVRTTIKQKLDRYVDIKESDIDIQVKEKMLIAYVPLVGQKYKSQNTQFIYTSTEQEAVNYESNEKRSAELKTIQS